MFCVLVCIFMKFVSPFSFFLRLRIIISVEQTVRQMINNGLSVSDVMFLVYSLSQFSYNSVRLTKPFSGPCTFCITLHQVKSILFKFTHRSGFHSELNLDFLDGLTGSVLFI
jgi:hypothetical protein